MRNSFIISPTTSPMLSLLLFMAFTYLSTISYTFNYNN